MNKDCSSGVGELEWGWCLWQVEEVMIRMMCICKGVCGTVVATCSGSVAVSFNHEGGGNV